MAAIRLDEAVIYRLLVIQLKTAETEIGGTFRIRLLGEGDPTISADEVSSNGIKAYARVVRMRYNRIARGHADDAPFCGWTMDVEVVAVIRDTDTSLYVWSTAVASIAHAMDTRTLSGNDHIVEVNPVVIESVEGTSEGHAAVIGLVTLSGSARRTTGESRLNFFV